MKKRKYLQIFVCAMFLLLACVSTVGTEAKAADQSAANVATATVEAPAGHAAAAQAAAVPVRTGDRSHIAIYALVILGAALAVVIVLIYRKRRK